MDALERFFDHVPGDSGMAFVVVQHLSPDFKSLMDELLARHTPMPIHLVEDGIEVQPNHVYLIPPKKEMIIAEGRLLLSERDPQHELALPIDVFFRSLAQDCGGRAVAIVLSGGGSDGSRGVRDIAEAGGLVIVQDAASAQFDGMPRTALDAGVAHWVLTPEEMPRVLLDHAGALAGRTTAPPAPVATNPDGLEAIYRMLQDAYHIDFTHYKPSTVTRRIERRLALARSHDINEYVRRLRDDREELDVLYRDLLIGVTRFFRDDAAFALLEQRVLPEILERTPRDAPVRVWVAACATGEEAYSLAIVLSELMLKSGETRPVKIFATDVHRGSLERAVRGLYDEEAVGGVSPERLARYFRRTGSNYQVVPDIRQMVVFAQHDVIRDAPFTRVDLIACRNLLIYLQPAIQQKVLSLFHFALNRGGALFLGPSETVGSLARDFETVDKHWQIHRKHTDVRIPVESRLQPARGEGRNDARLGAASLLQTSTGGGRYSLAELMGTYDALLEDVMPPSLLLSDRGELVHVFGGASRFLRLRDGRQGLELVDLVDPQLKMVLMGGIKRALNEPSAIVFNGVRLETGGDNGMFRVTIRRVRGRNGGAPHVLVSFEAMETQDGAAAGGGAGAGNAEQPGATEINLHQISNEQLRAMELELAHTKENLQAAIEELESSNEELQSSNEELQTSNEELQSTNEELQSVNEELYTVNAEYQRKITELVELTNDMDNLLSSTEVGTIFLDGSLRIRKFTPQIAERFRLVPHDIGRSIETFAYKMDHPEMVDDLKRVLAEGAPVERELRDPSGRTLFLRVLPYRAMGTIDGVVLTLIDVSGLKAAEDALFHERYLLNSLLLSVPDAIYFKDARGRFIRANHAMARRLALRDPAEIEGRTAFDLPDQGTALGLHAHDEAVLRSGEAQHYKLERRDGGNGREEWDLVTRLPLRDAAGTIVGIIVIFRNVTEQKQAEARIQEAVRRRDQFLAMLSHELRNPLGAMVTATALLKADGASARSTARFLDILDRQSHQMARLLDDLLEASRVTQNKIDLKRSIVDLAAVTREAADAVRGVMESKGIELDADIPAAPVCVDGDPARLQQIQVNLLSNAAKYTQRGGHVRLTLGCERGDAVVRVRDDGAGIPPEMLESIFELFVQSSRTLDRSAGGLGVGLTLVRSLVTMHGGTVTARSDGEGRGSEFLVRIPLAEDMPSSTEITAPDIQTSLAPRPRPALGAGSKVMIVEDSPDSREMLCELLQRQGLHCKTTDSGAAALALADQIDPDVAILDVGLPEMDGFEVARRLRANPRHQRMWLIALTGYGQMADRAAAQAAGFDEHLVKPVRADQLLELLLAPRARSAAAGVNPRPESAPPATEPPPDLPPA